MYVYIEWRVILCLEEVWIEYIIRYSTGLYIIWHMIDLIWNPRSILYCVMGSSLDRPPLFLLYKYETLQPRGCHNWFDMVDLLYNISRSDWPLCLLGSAFHPSTICWVAYPINLMGTLVSSSKALVPSIIVGLDRCTFPLSSEYMLAFLIWLYRSRLIRCSLVGCKIQNHCR